MDQRLRGVGALALAFALGCGEDAAPPPQQRSMAPPAPAERAADAPNRAPIIDRVEIVPSSPSPSVPIEAKVRASDPDGDRVEIRYTWKANGRPVGSEEELAPGTVSRDDRLELIAVASDGTTDSAPMSTTVVVGAATPMIREITFDPIEPKPGDKVTALVDAGGVDGRMTFSYKWMVNGKPVGDDAKTFSAQGLRRGDRIQVRVVARDGDVASDPTTSGYVEVANTPPKLKGVPTPVKEGDAFKYAFEAEDADGDSTFRYSLSEAPSGMTIDPIDGVATWRPTKEQAGPQTIEVTVKDAAGGASALRFTVEVTAATPEPTAKQDGNGYGNREAKQEAKPEAAPPAKPAELRFSDDPDPADAAADEEAAEEAEE